MAHDTRDAPPRPFTDVLKEIETGFLEDELSERFAGVVDAVRRQGKAGSLTITLNVKPVSGAEDMVTMAAAVREKRPTPDRAPSTFFVARDGSPSKHHPSQMMIEPFKGEDGDQAR
jgi:hypothetical protein